MKHKKFVPCRKGCCSKRLGYRESVNDNRERVLTECERHIAWRRDAAVYEAFIKSGFDKSLFDVEYPKDYVGNKSRANMERVVSYVEKFPTSTDVQKCLLYITGNNGCQKTMIGNFVGKQLIAAGFDVQFCLMDKLLKALTQEQFDENARTWLIAVRKADLLIVDESFDVSKLVLSQKSGYQIPYCDAFLREWITQKGIIIMSNVRIKDISTDFKMSLKDLMLRKTDLYNSELEFLDNWRDLASEESKMRGIF